MAENDIKFKITADSSGLTKNVEKAADALKEMDAKGTAGVKRLADSFDTLKGTLIGGGVIAALAAVAAGVKASIAAAAEAEAVQASLGAALKATGRYSEETVRGINQWSQAMLQGKGVSDELATTLVAEGVAMGKTVEQSKRLAEAAADMAPIVGSVEGAFSLLIRASNGSMESLKRYGVAVSEAEMKSGDFEGVLKRIEKQFSGQAEAGINTFNGQLALMKENLGNIAEKVGEPMLAFLVDFTTGINEALTAAENLNAGLEKILNKDLKKIAGITALLTNNPALAAQLLLGGDGLPKGTPGAMVSSHGRLPDEMVRSHGPGVKPWAPFAPVKGPDNDAAKKAADAAYKAWVDWFRETQQSILAALKEREAMVDADIAAMRSKLSTREIGKTDLRAMAIQEYRMTIAASVEDVVDPLQRLGAEFDAEARLAGYRKQAQEQLDKTNKDSAEAAAKAAKARASSDMEAVQAAYQFGQALVALGQNLRAGNTGGTISSLGNIAMMAGAATGNPVLVGVGAAASLTGGLIAPGTPGTYGGRSRNDLQNIFGDVGLKDKTATTEELAATGMTEVYDAWGRMILGVSKDFGGAGEIVYGKLKKLNLTFDETAQAVSYVNAQANEMTMAASNMATAWAAMIVPLDLSASQIGDLTDLYQQGYQWTERYKAATESLLSALQSGSKQQVDASQATVAALLQEEAARKEAAKRMLEEAGVSAIDQAKLEGGIDESNFWLEQIAKNTAGSGDGMDKPLHQGRMVAGYPSHRYWIRDDEAVVPPEKAYAYASDVLRRSGGGGSYDTTVVVTLDGREIARNTARHTRALTRTREI